MSEQSHAIDVDLEKILPILAREIYSTPFAFLRENVQNAFDAVRIQIYRDSKSGVNHPHQITVNIHQNKISISDTGIGMSAAELKSLFWSIGKSGKHTDEAKSAGVVGTFGIGGMANFGVCSRLDVSTKKYGEVDAVNCWAERSNLSAKDECVFYESGDPNASPGTKVTGTLMQAVTQQQVIQYLTPIIQYLDVPINVNGINLTGIAFPRVERSDGKSVVVSNGPAKIQVFLRVLKNGQAQTEIESFTWNGQLTSIRGVLSTNSGVIAAYQHGFMLANVPISSVFGLGGALDCQLLRPTAGREAVTDESRGIVQQIVLTIEKAIAEYIAITPDLPDQFSAFFRYLQQFNYWHLAENATIRVFAANRQPMAWLKQQTGGVFYANDRNDQAIMQAYRENGKIVAILSTDAHRRSVEIGFLTQHCKAKQLSDTVTCLRMVDDLGWDDLSLKYRLGEKLKRQYLIENLKIHAGELSHGAMIWVPPKQPETGSGISLFIDFSRPNVKRLVGLRDAVAFDALCDVFIRDNVLPHMEMSFPELKKRDFDTMLRKLQSSVEFFEVDPNDISRLHQLAAITNMSPETIAAVLGANKPGRPVRASVNRSDVARVGDIVQQNAAISPDKMQQEFTQNLLEMDTSDIKILDATTANPTIGLCNYYLALTTDAHVLYRRIFLERNPSSDFSWGGYRAGYLFYSEGVSVVYYDIEFGDLINVEERGLPRSGTYSIGHKALISKNMVYLPIPKEFESHIVPDSSTKRFRIQHQIMGLTEVHPSGVN